MFGEGSQIGGFGAKKWLRPGVGTRVAFGRDTWVGIVVGVGFMRAILSGGRRGCKTWGFDQHTSVIYELREY